jgi:hypothetical protein
MQCNANLEAEIPGFCSSFVHLAGFLSPEPGIWESLHIALSDLIYSTLMETAEILQELGKRFINDRPTVADTIPQLMQAKSQFLTSAQRQRLTIAVITTISDHALGGQLPTSNWSRNTPYD